MKSIRRSLILKVLVLSVVTLAAVFGLSYRIVERTLAEKKRAFQELFDLQFDKSIDDALHQEATSLGQLTVFQARSRLLQLDYALLGLMTVPGSHYGHVQTPLWCLEYARGGESSFLRGLLAARIEPDSESLLGSSEAAEHEYRQINGRFGLVWRHPRADGYELPFETDYLTSSSAPQEHYDNITLVGSGQRLRRYRVRLSLGKFRQVLPPQILPATRGTLAGGFAAWFEPRGFGGPPGRPRDGGQRGGPAGPSPPGVLVGATAEGSVYESEVPKVVVQVAWNLDSGHPRVLEFEAKRREQLEQLDEETRVSLAGLTANFFLIGAAALSLLFIGGSVLIGLALSPLGRLSAAVSEISPKDFRLPIEVNTLPKEVEPVAARLQASLADLQKLFEREKRAAADISHELRTPLAALTTTLDVTLRKPRTEEKYRETLQDCRDIARQMSHLVERLLTLAWIDAGADRLLTQDVEIGPLISECSTIGRPLAEAHGLRFSATVPERMTVHTDRDKLREVLMNLVHNAIEYNRPGGSIEVSASPQQNGGVVFEVRDTGIGIARDMQEKIFERFYRGDPSRNAAGAHAGLGLAIVKEYIDRLGGTLTLDSTPGEGSRFRVELPA